MEKEGFNSLGANPEYMCLLGVYTALPWICVPFFSAQYAKFTHTKFQAFPKV